MIQAGELLDKKQMQEFCGFTGSYIPHWGGYGRPLYGVHFPTPVKRGNRNYWLKSDLEQWIEARNKFRRRTGELAAHRQVSVCAQCGTRWPCPTRIAERARALPNDHIVDVLSLIANCNKEVAK